MIDKRSDSESSQIDILIKSNHLSSRAAPAKGHTRFLSAIPTSKSNSPNVSGEEHEDIPKFKLEEPTIIISEYNPLENNK